MFCSQTPRAASDAIEIASPVLYHAAEDRLATALAGAIKVAGMDDSSFISHEAFDPDICLLRCLAGRDGR